MPVSDEVILEVMASQELAARMQPWEHPGPTVVVELTVQSTE